jgi:hypothetical protein
MVCSLSKVVRAVPPDFAVRGADTKSYASSKVFTESEPVRLRAGVLPNVIEASIPVIEVLS